MASREYRVAGEFTVAAEQHSYELEADNPTGVTVRVDGHPVASFPVQPGERVVVLVKPAPLPEGTTVTIEER